MRIAHIIDSPYASHGGLTVLAREIACGLAGEFETWFVCPSPQQSNEDEPSRPQGVTLMQWNNESSYTQIEKFISSGLDNAGIDVAIVHGGDFAWGPIGLKLSIVNRIAREGRRVVLVNHQSNLVFSRIPITEGRNYVASIKSFARFVAAWSFKHIQLWQTEREVTVSQFEYEQARRRYFIFRKKFTLIYHSRLAEGSGGEENPPVGGKKQSILSVGHLAERKGQHVLVEAFGLIAKKHPSWKLEIVGSSGKNHYHERLSGIIAKHGIVDQVRLIAETHEPDRYFREAAIYVQPSLMEAYGLALQEAMHYRCACVGAMTGGIPESIVDEDYLFDNGDSKQLSVILDRLMSDDSLLRRRMERCASDSQQFGRTRAQMLEAYRTLLGAMATYP